jgi:hypothetical protein
MGTEDEKRLVFPVTENDVPAIRWLVVPNWMVAFQLLRILH